MRAVLGLIAVLVCASCGGASPGPSSSPPQRPPAIEADTIGLLVGEHVYADRTEFLLANGTSWTRPNSGFRRVYDRPAGSTLFIAGSDSSGPWVLLVGGQDGLPSDCTHAIGYGGVDFGDGVAAAGFLWPKAPSFSGTADTSIYGSLTRFCLDNQARVSGRVDLSPPN